MDRFNIKGIIFDYGGTIDSRGDHWSEILWDGYNVAGIPVSKEDFRDCYVHAERELAKLKHILPHHNFYDLLLIKVKIELEYLVKEGILVAANVDDYAQRVATY